MISKLEQLTFSFSPGYEKYIDVANSGKATTWQWKAYWDVNSHL